MKSFLSIAVLFCGAGAWAQDADAPGRGVARISVINGDVSVRRGDSGDWVAAAVNAPLVVQDRVLTGAASRAEVQFDYANMIRLASDTEIRLSELEYRRYQIQVARGTVTYRVLRNSDSEVEVSAPAVSVRPSKQGVYRVSVRDDGETEVTVRSGEVEVFTTRGVERLKSGKTMMVRGTSSDPEFQVVASIARDDWDRWNELRDRDLERSGSYRYVHRDVYGAEDLDDHGHWVSVDTYGWVWRPRVHVDWAPYRHGRWSWVDWYGWTWVSHDPWGWAPYHYGRWFHRAGHGWHWYPGGHGRHYWRPALVAFFGLGNFRVGLGFGRVGWVPLGPYEPYYPWYGRQHYGNYRGVNIVNNVNITNVYRNSRVHNAISGVDAGDFSRGRFNNVARVSHDDVRQASVVRGMAPVAPTSESLRVADREARAIPRASSEDGRFYSRRQPSSVERVPFEEQRRGMERVSRAAAPVDTTVDRSDPAARGWRRFGEPAGRQESGAVRRAESTEGRRGFNNSGDNSGGATVRRSETARTESTPEGSRGWRRFGEPGSTGSPSSWIDRGEGSSRVRRESNESGRESGRRPERVESRPESVQISPPVVRERERSTRTERQPSYGEGRSAAPSTIYRGEGGGGSSSRSPRGGESGGGRVYRGGGEAGGGQSGGQSGGMPRGGGGSTRSGRDR